MHHDYEKLGALYLGGELDPASVERGGMLLLDSRDLTTHGVIIGMTGSGKTGLGVGLIEEAAIDRIPVIAIDPKGDLDYKGLGNTGTWFIGRLQTERDKARVLDALD